MTTLAALYGVMSERSFSQCIATPDAGRRALPSNDVIPAATAPIALSHSINPKTTSYRETSQVGGKCSLEGNEKIVFVLCAIALVADLGEIPKLRRLHPIRAIDLIIERALTAIPVFQESVSGHH